jgi:hypothetical protein
MSKRLVTLTVALVVSSGIGVGANAADVEMLRDGRTRIVTASPNCQDVWRCGPAGCNWRRVCTRPCPDHYSCYPLYGAYGPYGGVAYWGSYTDTGWGY